MSTGSSPRRRSWPPTRASQPANGVRQNAAARGIDHRGNHLEMAEAARRPGQEIRGPGRNHHRQGKRGSSCAIGRRPEGDQGKGRHHRDGRNRDRRDRRIRGRHPTPGTRRRARSSLPPGGGGSGWGGPISAWRSPSSGWGASRISNPVIARRPRPHRGAPHHRRRARPHRGIGRRWPDQQERRRGLRRAARPNRRGKW